MLAYVNASLRLLDSVCFYSASRKLLRSHERRQCERVWKEKSNETVPPNISDTRIFIRDETLVI